LPSVSVIDQEQQHEQQQQQYRFAQQQKAQFSDPAIMSASFGVSLMAPQDVFGHAQQTYGPPPGLAYPSGLPNNVINDGKHSSLLFARGGLRAAQRMHAFLG